MNWTTNFYFCLFFVEMEVALSYLINTMESFFLTSKKRLYEPWTDKSRQNKFKMWSRQQKNKVGSNQSLFQTACVYQFLMVIFWFDLVLENLLHLYNSYKTLMLWGVEWLYPSRDLTRLLCRFHPIWCTTDIQSGSS